ncbi:hypothetical protein ACFLYH_00640 [Candidatus Dependentiae bacterium]
MRIKLKIIYFFIFLFFNLNIFPTTHTNKTFLMPRPIGENMAIRYGSWNNQIENARFTKRGSTFQVSPFYQHSTNKSEQGKYFGYYAQDEKKFRDYIDVVNVDEFADVGDSTWAPYIVHDIMSGEHTQNLAGKIRFRPYQEIYGAYFDYYQNMYQLLDGLFLEISVPVVNIKNNLDLADLDTLTPITINDDEHNHPSYGKNLRDYFKGNVYDMANTYNSNSQQKPLKNSKIDGSKSRSGMSDLKLKLGYRVIDKKSWWLSFNGYCDIPTGNRPTGEFLFEPVCGNGGHWFVGFGPDIRWNIWNDEKKYFNFFSSFQVSYGIESSEKRTLGIKKDDGTPVPFSQYYLVGELGVRHLMPFANVSTLDLSVTPKWMFEGLISLDFSFSNFHFGAGYNLFLKEKESVFLKKNWEDDIYGIADVEYITSDGAATFLYNGDGLIDDAGIDENILGQHTIGINNLDIDSATTPSQVTNKIYGSLGYITDWQNPLGFFVGASYEWANSNSTFDNYSFWSNVNFAF